MNLKINLKLPIKLSTNEYYAGKHWSARSRIKESYTRLVRAQTKAFFPKKSGSGGGFVYDVGYDFEFKSRPLDCSNCSVMVKMIEDILFESDAPSVVRSVTISSKKGLEDKVAVTVNVS